MREARVGRIVAASVHQGVADVLPSRLEYYEDWLKPMALRRGGVGLAAFSAVLSFLRHEGAYDEVMHVAGRHAAEWQYVGSSPTWRGLCRRLPQRLRVRVALGRVGALVASTVVGGDARASASRGPAGLVVRHSPFCVVREPAAQPLCRFYASAGTRFLELFDLALSLEMTQCAGVTRGPSCTLAAGPPAGRADGGAE